MKPIGRRLLVPAIAILILGTFAAGTSFARSQEVGTPRARSQEAGTRYPAAVHAGTCDNFDLVPLYLLTSPTVPTGNFVGPDEATTAARSRSVIPVPLEKLLTEDHVIVVRGSDDEPGSPASTSVACGEIGGLRRGEGALVIGLREANESFFAGISGVLPNPDNSAETVVTVYVFEWA